MNFDDIWDWAFMWQMTRNFMATGSPFVMISVAVSITGALLGMLVSMFLRRKN